MSANPTPREQVREKRISAARTEILRCVFPAFDDHESVTLEEAESRIDEYRDALLALPAPEATGGEREGSCAVDGCPDDGALVPFGRFDLCEGHYDDVLRYQAEMRRAATPPAGAPPPHAEELRHESGRRELEAVVRRTWNSMRVGFRGSVAGWEALSPRVREIVLTLAGAPVPAAPRTEDAVQVVGRRCTCVSITTAHHPTCQLHQPSNISLARAVPAAEGSGERGGVADHDGARELARTIIAEDADTVHVNLARAYLAAALRAAPVDEAWIPAERERRALERELGAMTIVRPFAGDEEESVRLVSRIYLRLKELGWRDAMYAPKDSSPLDCIEAGCSVVLTNCARDENGFWHYDGNDTWPLTPVLFRAALAPSAEGGSRDA